MKIINKINDYRFSTYGSGLVGQIYALNNLYGLRELIKKAKELNVPVEYERSTYDGSFELVSYDNKIVISESKSKTIEEKIEELTSVIKSFSNVDKVIFSHKNWKKINEELQRILLKAYDVELNDDIDYDGYDED